MDYYTKYIKERADWEFVAVYTDEGISATNTKKRDGFKQMISDALDGKIDLIITKLVSRFARKTVDFLTKATKANEGEVPQYYVQNSHPAIIDPDEFDAVQTELERRKKLGRPVSCHSPFSAKIVCGECGGVLRLQGQGFKHQVPAYGTAVQ
ncbi:MAG: recombinase family protein [Bacillota bacterium]|nr:recombinase family protein [Bacillota bacterium]